MRENFSQHEYFGRELYERALSILVSSFGKVSTRNYEFIEFVELFKHSILTYRILVDQRTIPLWRLTETTV